MWQGRSLAGAVHSRRRRPSISLALLRIACAPEGADEAEGGDGWDGDDEGGDAEADNEQVEDVPRILPPADGLLA